MLEQQLVDVRTAEGGIPTSGKRPTGLHDGHVDSATPKIKDGDRPLIPRKTGRVEERGGHRLRHKDDANTKPVPSLPKHPGTNGPPVGGVSEHELVNGPAAHPLRLGNGPGKHGANNVANLENTGPQQKLGFINPPLGKRLKPRGIDGSLPLSLLPNKERPIIPGINGGRYEGRPINGHDLRLPPPNRDGNTRTGRTEVDRHPQCHPHPR